MKIKCTLHSIANMFCEPQYASTGLMFLYANVAFFSVLTVWGIRMFNPFTKLAITMQTMTRLWGINWPLFIIASHLLTAAIRISTSVLQQPCSSKNFGGWWVFLAIFCSILLAEIITCSAHDHLILDKLSVAQALMFCHTWFTSILWSSYSFEECN